MPQLSPITLIDSQGVGIEYKPRDISQGVAKLASPTGVPIGDPSLTISRTQTAAGRHKVTVKLAMPEIQKNTINGVDRPTVARTAYADLTFSFDGGSTSAERLDMMTQVSYLLAKDFQPFMVAVVRDGEGIY